MGARHAPLGQRRAGGAFVPAPAMVVLILKYLHDRHATGRRTMSCAPPTSDLGELFRGDAKAEKDYAVRGGWCSRDNACA